MTKGGVLIEKYSKTLRLLQLFKRFSAGEVILKKPTAQQYGVSEKAIQRDIDDLRIYLAEIEPSNVETTIVYDTALKGYTLVGMNEGQLTPSEVYVLLKVILESRAFPLDEMNDIITKMLSFVHPTQQKHIQEMIRNEQFLYVPLQHNQLLSNKMWELSVAVKHRRKIRIDYLRVGDTEAIEVEVQPVGLIFSEFYFYLIAYVAPSERDFPTAFRLDRMKDYEVLKTGFRVVDKDRFQEGEFRKQIQFMQTGPLVTIKFRFYGKSLEAVLDRLPNATVTYDAESPIIEASVYGRGIIMWLLSQGDKVNVLAPQEIRAEMKDTIEKMWTRYGG